MYLRSFASNSKTHHWKTHVIGGSYLSAFLLLLVVAGYHLGTGNPIAEFTRDPAALMDRSPLVGCLSKLGILLWAAGASVAFFTAALLPRGERPGGLLASLAGLTALLLLDDLFMLHEYLGPRHLGLPEEIFVSLYATLGLGTLLYFRRSWFGMPAGSMPVGAFLAAGLFLGGSVLADLLFTWIFLLEQPDWTFFIEDGLKFLGIAGWTSTLVWTSARALKDVQTDSEQTARVEGTAFEPVASFTDLESPLEMKEGNSSY